MDIYKANHVREMMNSLKGLAEQQGIALVLVRHYRKSGGAAIHRGAGSIDYSAAAHSILAVTKDDHDRDLRYMSHAKCSYARKGATWSYRLENGLHWLREETESADQLTERDPELRERREEKKHAKDICRTFLADGEWHPSADLIAQAAEEGISDRTLKRARRELRVEVD